MINQKTPADIAILCALPEEFVANKERLTHITEETTLAGNKIINGYYGDVKVTLMEIGLGGKNATFSTTNLLNHYEPQVVSMCGIGGHFNKEHKVGDTFIPNQNYLAEAVSHEGLRPLFPEWNIPPLIESTSEKLIPSLTKIKNVEFGNSSTSQVFPELPNADAENAKRKPLTIDMESNNVLFVCNKMKNNKGETYPAYVVRSSSNYVKDPIAKENILIASHEAANKNFEIIDQLVKDNIITASGSKGQLSVKEELEQILTTGFVKHPEGGYYKQTYRACQTEKVDGKQIPQQTKIYYILEKNILDNENHFSSWHKLRDSQKEEWRFIYSRGINDEPSLTVHALNTKAKQKREFLINRGSENDTVKNGDTFAASLDQDGFLICECTVTEPGFDYGFFQLMDAAPLKQAFPNHQQLIDDHARELREQLKKKEKSADHRDLTSQQHVSLKNQK